MCNRYRPASVVRIRDAFGFTYIESGPDLRTLKPAIGPLQLGPFVRSPGDIVVGQWGLTPDGSKSLKPTRANGIPLSTNNCRWDAKRGMPEKHSFRGPWLRGQRCLVFAEDYDEPCYAVTSRNIWWRFARADGQPWALAGLWNVWTDPETGEMLPSYTVVTVNCNAHPLLSLMHKPDTDDEGRELPREAQDKRSVVALEPEHWSTWLSGTNEDAGLLIGELPPLACFAHGPADPNVSAVLPIPAW